MTIVVMSDSHTAYGRVLDIVQCNQSADLFLHLGDGEDEFDRVAAQYPEKAFLGVRGNNDWHSEKPAVDFITVEGVKIMFTHGHLFSVKWGLDQLIREGVAQDARIILYGHSHVARKDYVDGRYVINPGSVADGSMTPAGYLVLDITPGGIMPVHRTIEHKISETIR